MTRPTGGAFLSPAQLSAEFDIPTKTLTTWRYHSTGPAYHKFGTSVRYARVDIDAWLNANRVTTH